jgi:hypothetical protein
MLQHLYDYIFLKDPKFSEKDYTYGKLEDFFLEDLVLVRKEDNRVFIYWLWTTDVLEIPVIWLNIISGYDFYDGSRFIGLIEPEDNKAERFFWNLWHFWKSGFVEHSPTYEKYLNNLLRIGSTEFRKWFSERLEKDLPEWGYSKGFNYYSI